MARERMQALARNISAVLVFSRPLLVFAAFVSALWLMFSGAPAAYVLGVTCLLLSMVFDWVDGWFAARFIPHSRLGPLADRMLDRLVLSIIFPVLGAGMLWRYSRLVTVDALTDQRHHLLHALFVLGLCVIVLMRDQIAAFLRSFARRRTMELEPAELTRLRTLVFSPMAVLLYAYAFYQPAEAPFTVYRYLTWIDLLPLRVWFVLESVFLVINVASVSLLIRRYGPLALEELTGDDERLRRRILAVIPNALTLINGLLGITAMIFATQGRVREAVFVLVGAALFDRLDGALARRLGLTEPLSDAQPGHWQVGAVLDDISDAVSFALAPAVIFYYVLVALPGVTLEPMLLSALALLYGLAGVARLLYFTLDRHPIPGFFKGMPVPAAALLVTAPVEIAAHAAERGSTLVGLWAAMSAVVLIVAAVAMNLYPVRYLHVGRLLSRKPRLLWVSALAALVAVFTPVFGWMLLVLSLVYLLSPLRTWRISPEDAAREKPA